MRQKWEQLRDLLVENDGCVGGRSHWKHVDLLARVTWQATRPEMRGVRARREAKGDLNLAGGLNSMMTVWGRARGPASEETAAPDNQLGEIDRGTARGDQSRHRLMRARTAARLMSSKSLCAAQERALCGLVLS